MEIFSLVLCCKSNKKAYYLMLYNRNKCVSKVHSRLLRIAFNKKSNFMLEDGAIGIELSSIDPFDTNNILLFWPINQLPCITLLIMESSSSIAEILALSFAASSNEDGSTSAKLHCS